MKKLDLSKTQMNLTELQSIDNKDLHEKLGCIYSITACSLSVTSEDLDSDDFRNTVMMGREATIYPSIANQMAFQFNYCPICGKDLREEDE